MINDILLENLMQGVEKQKPEERYETHPIRRMTWWAWLFMHGIGWMILWLTLRPVQ